MSYRSAVACVAALMLGLVAPVARAEQPISIIVAYAAGGTTDTLARIIGARLSDKLGTPVIIENKAGATGQIGSRYVAKAAPDGRTLQIATQTTHAVAPSLYPNIGYDPMKDFTPISLVAWSPLVLVTNPSFPPKTVQELIAYIKARPKEVSFATGGRGDGSFMAAMFFNNMAKINPVAVPFPGEAPALPQVLGGQLPYMFCSAPTVAASIEAGQLNALAVTSKVRASNLPKVPTMAESGLPGYEMVNWWGFFGPAGMAPYLVKKLNTAFVDILKEPDTKAKLEALGYELTGTSSDEFKAYVGSEIDKWAALVKAEAAVQQQ
ncbi:tripartite tricarboxylate transporter substrate binding protein [Aquabacter sp. CN5-332]|uniref:Bug family tripartite tricarboxylate transporter substrate binding protein n=1 Tax=Aquabacter sp. CN5-332 TaxID=3156608 RepID=UPI0032B34B5B